MLGIHPRGCLVAFNCLINLIILFVRTSKIHVRLRILWPELLNVLVSPYRAGKVARYRETNRVEIEAVKLRKGCPIRNESVHLQSSRCARSV